ncbi:hypothetical protein LOC68_23275 [Blastopirellula sp. JC732]|uniref:Lipoprotein n=1 Tax=Blastopirellula sediminis TaxID=2894196 RepID=A0A9X1MR29_9BACT|nr:hypothetical protein [Blastopirellula sediminis]MCC9605374.1 hypothetical protein [Blastopirellula sediminis]MCC9631326.1 hypothetical protein [Blastopirellula sediminis]
MSRFALAACFLAFLVGCDAEPIGKRQSGPVAPGGVALPSVESPSAAVGPGAQPSGPAMTETPPAETAPAAQPEERGVIGKTTNKVVDVHKALQDPEIVIPEGASADGIDPFSAAGSAYFSAMARVSTLGMQQAVQMKKAVEGRWPTYDEYMQIMKENNVEFAKLRSYEMYGYDDKTGKIMVLMDKRLYQEHLDRVGK